MAGTSLGGQKAVNTILERHGEDFYKIIGSKGGKISHKKMTHCRRGHVLEDPNVIYQSRNRRTCKTCWKASQKRYEARRRMAEIS
jgi:hypothetical protein